MAIAFADDYRRLIDPKDEWPRLTMPELMVVMAWPREVPYQKPGALQLDDEKGNSLQAPAVVNHGRWIVECPTLGCGGAQLASSTDNRFFCTDCLNVLVEGRWMAVKWPPASDVRRIDAVLTPRPVEARNWRPGESIADLEAENEAYLEPAIVELLVATEFAPPPAAPDDRMPDTLPWMVP